MTTTLDLADLLKLLGQPLVPPTGATAPAAAHPWLAALRQITLADLLQFVSQRNAASTEEPPDEIILAAPRKITLQCGLSSITLHANGKIVPRGEYIVSDANGVQRIVGGQIDLN